MRKFTILVSGIGALAAVAVTADDAQANARICRQLQHEARELRQMGSGVSRASLQRELNRAEQQVRRAGCSGFRLLFGGLAKRQCHTLRANVSRLRQQARGANSGRSPEHRLRGVEAEMRRHGCSDGSQQASEGGGGYRTLCVRKCDGYYFPIGFATPKNRLERDRAVCNSFYPHGAAELYVHPSGSANAEEAMVSLDGEAYAERPFAFAYRSAYQPACVAMLHAGVAATAEHAKRRVEIKASAIVPIPVPRPSRGSETSVAAASDRPGVHPADRTDGTIRVVGPATPYLVSKPADDSIAPVAANAAPKRVVPAEPGIGAAWLDQISSLVAPAAQAEEGAR